MPHGRCLGSTRSSREVASETKYVTLSKSQDTLLEGAFALHRMANDAQLFLKFKGIGLSGYLGTLSCKMWSLRNRCWTRCDAVSVRVWLVEGLGDQILPA